MGSSASLSLCTKTSRLWKHSPAAEPRRNKANCSALETKVSLTEEEVARGVASLHVHANANANAKSCFTFIGLNIMSKASAAGTRAAKEGERLRAGATAQTAFSAEMDGDEDKKGFPTKEQPRSPQISSWKVSGALRGAQVLMDHLLGASWHVPLPAVHW